MKYTRNKRELQANKSKPVKVIGLTGGIASGKTVATSALKKTSFTVIDADEISRTSFARGTDGERTLMQIFPAAATNGALDRAKLRNIISRDDKERVKLNETTHPIIIAEIKRIISTAKGTVVLSAPLLFESGLSALCDCTVCVYCPRKLRISWLTARDGITAADAERIIDAQIPDTERCTMSDYIVPNGGDEGAFVEEIVELFREIVINS